MRAIDADALIEKCGDWYVEEGTESGFIGTLKNLLAAQPPIQPVATDTNVGSNSEIPNSWDCISRQQAIDIVVFECGKWTGLAKEISKRLKRLPPAQPEQRWIPVKREVPENPGYYITSSEYGGVTVDFYYNYFWNAQKNAYKVLAWMPLPEPYKPNK